MTPRVRQAAHVIFRSIMLTALVSLVCGMLYEAWGSRMDAQRFPIVGKLYTIGGRQWNLNCTGQGSPTVILESGLGSPAYGWYKVQPGVAAFTRVCSYDRAGYGWSDRHSGPRSSRVIVQELHALLSAAGVRPPYILVGHSFGGFNIRVFHGIYPEEVAGLVFVDSSHEDQASRMSAGMREQTSRAAFFANVIPAAINIGLVRAVRQFHELPLVPSTVAGRDRGYLEYLTLQPKTLRAARAELDLFSTDSAQQVRESGSLGNKPIIVLTAGLASGPDPEFSRVWKDELQPAIARLSLRSRREVIADSTHMMPYERPDAIVAAIREVREIAMVGD